MVSINEMKSPGVFVQEVDLSAYTAVMNTSVIFGVITVAQNGPIDEVVDIASTKEYEKTFGNPISYGGLACRYLLDETSSLKVVRVAGASASARSVTLAGTDSSEEVIESAVIVSFKNKGTLFADAVKATVSAISGATADKFNLKITKGTNNEVLLDKAYTIVAANATDEIPYLISDTSTEFVFALGGESVLASITPAEDLVFSVGDNGEAFTDAEIKAAIDVFDDAENIELDILAAPGIVTGAAIGELSSVAKNRKITTAVIDCPKGLSVEDAVKFFNGENTAYQIAKIDSTYSAGYYPWGYAYNEYSGSSEWMPPSVGVLAALAKEYSNYDRWTAPAGVPRFTLSVFSSMERLLNRADRDLLYENNINPLCNYKGLGLTALGQKTFQRSLTATNRLNVRFLLNYIKKLADVGSVKYLFNEISENTFDSWTQDMDKILKNIKDRGGLYDYQIKMDWETVTDEMLNNNIMPGIIKIKPTKTAEFIPIDVEVYNKSDNF